VILSQVPVERVWAIPHIDDLRMVRCQNPVDDTEALQPLVVSAGVAISKQSRVSRLLEIIKRDDVEMGDVEDRAAE
jgi:hypothetical protein